MSDYQEYPNYNLPFLRGCKRTQPFGWSDFANSSKGRAVYFNRPHEGTDWISWDESANPEVRSVCDGTVIIDNDSYYGRPFNSYGCNVIIKQDGTNNAWYYCHLLSNTVTGGQKVKQGDVIGLMGGSGQGRSTAWATHLHLGLAILDNINTRINSDNESYGFIDPLPELEKLNNQTPIIMPDPNLQAVTILTELQKVDSKYKEPWISGRLTEGTQKFAELLAELHDTAKLDGHRDLLTKLINFFPELFKETWVSARLNDGRTAFNDLMVERFAMQENNFKKTIANLNLEITNLKKNSNQNESQKVQEFNNKIAELYVIIAALVEQNELKQTKINDLQSQIDSFVLSEKIEMTVSEK